VTAAKSPYQDPGSEGDLSRRQASTVSSLATTPFASTLVSRSTSQSSEIYSLPITPPTELPTLANIRRAVAGNISLPQFSSTSNAMPFAASHKVPTTDDVETPLLNVEQLADLHATSHLTQHQTTCDTGSSAYPQDKSLSDKFVEELFEEGDAAKRLVELQGHSLEGMEGP